MMFSKNALLSSIQSNWKSKKDGAFIKYAMDEIDKALQNVEVNESFYNEYYKLKKKVAVSEMVLPSLLVSLLVSAYIAIIPGVGTKLQSIEGFPALIALLVVIILMAVTFTIGVLYLYDKCSPVRDRVLEPYLLDRMGKKIEEHRAQRG